MFKPFPDLILKAMEGFHIEEMVLIDPPALEPALTLRNEGYRVYSIHTDPLCYRLFRSFVAGNYRKANHRKLSDVLAPMTRVASEIECRETAKTVLTTVWEDLPAPEDSLALWVLDRILLWVQENRQADGKVPRVSESLIGDLLQEGGSLLKDSRIPHLSVEMTPGSDISYVPGDGAMAFSGEVESLSYARSTLAASGLARFAKRTDYSGLAKHFPLVPVWLILGFGSPDRMKEAQHWAARRRKRVLLNPIYREENGDTHFLVVGWD
jgi:hypothetical protein